MARMKNASSSLVSDLTSQLERLVAAAREEGRAEALAEVASLVAGGKAPAPAKRGRGRPKGSKNKPKADRAVKPAKRAKKARKSSWTGLTPEQKLARVNAIRVGRGLPARQSL